MDPDFPLPYAGDGILLDDVTPAAIDEIVAAFVGSPLLHVEIRHLGGAAAVRSPDHGVLDAIDQPFVCFTFGIAPDAAAVAAVERQADALLGALGSWDSGRRYLNFAESRVDPRSIFPVETYDRLRRAKASYDPAGIFRANHPIDDERT
jgi:FAD/FMN-containing dehydrogenase